MMDLVLIVVRVLNQKKLNIGDKLDGLKCHVPPIEERERYVVLRASDRRNYMIFNKNELTSRRYEENYMTLNKK